MGKHCSCGELITPPETEHIFAADPPGALISSLRIERSPRHWYITIWNRGGKAGAICVNASDGQAIVDRLLPPDHREGFDA